MKQKLLIAAAATALMAAPTFASAQDSYGSQDAGWYLKGAAGYGTGTDIDATGLFEGDIEGEGNVAGNLGLGYDFGENWRLELDGTSMWNDYGAIAQTPQSFAKLRTDAVMLNAIYDFSDFERWAPYIGAGVGLVRADASLSAHDFTNVDAIGQITNTSCVGSRINPNGVGNDGYTCDSQDRDLGLGWQLLAGLGYAISDKLTWDTSYRYMQAADMDFDGAFANVATGASTADSVELDGIGAHQLLTGFRYRFGETTKVAPPPPPPVMPVADYRCWDGSMVFNAGQCPAQPPVEVVEVAPQFTCWDGTLTSDVAFCPAEPQMVTCPDGSLVSDINFCPRASTESIETLCGEQYRQEIIYYEFDKGASAETRNTINRILDAGQFCDIDNIRVVGHTDTSGAASYNLALSKRRATDALNELVRQGVNRNVITAEGKGETEPFVQTGDGVKEQLNRRTEVLITLGSIGAMVN